MSSLSIKRKLMRAQYALSETIKSILDINKRRKIITQIDDKATRKKLEEELKVLNATADIQAMMVKRYEKAVKRSERA